MNKVTIEDLAAITYASRMTTHLQQGETVTYRTFQDVAQQATDEIVLGGLQQILDLESALKLGSHIINTLANLFIAASETSARKSGITPEAGILLIDIEPAYANAVARTLIAAIGVRFADNNPEFVNQAIDRAEDPLMVAECLGKHRKYMQDANVTH